MNVNDNKGYSIQDAMKLLGISQGQAERLDALDGEDKVIGESIFNKAKAIKNGYDTLLTAFNDAETQQIRDILNIKIPFVDTTNKEYIHMQFENDMKKVVSDRIKFLESNKSILDNYQKEYEENGWNKGPAFAALRDAEYDDNGKLIRERYIPKDVDGFENEMRLLKCGIYDSDCLPQAIIDKYGDDIDSLLDKFNQKGWEVYDQKYGD